MKISSLILNVFFWGLFSIFYHSHPTMEFTFGGQKNHFGFDTQLARPFLFLLFVFECLQTVSLRLASCTLSGILTYIVALFSLSMT